MTSSELNAFEESIQDEKLKLEIQNLKSQLFDLASKLSKSQADLL